MRGILIAALCGLALVGCAYLPGAGAPAREPDMIGLQYDGRRAEMWFDSVPSSTVAVSREKALEAAVATFDPRDRHIAPSEARLVALSTRTMDDGQVQVNRRRTWLLKFDDVRFPVDPCVCDVEQFNLGTVVGVDAADGAILVNYGYNKTR